MDQRLQHSEYIIMLPDSISLRVRRTVDVSSIFFVWFFSLLLGKPTSAEMTWTHDDGNMLMLVRRNDDDDHHNDEQTNELPFWLPHPYP